MDPAETAGQKPFPECTEWRNETALDIAGPLCHGNPLTLPPLLGAAETRVVAAATKGIKFLLFRHFCSHPSHDRRSRMLWHLVDMCVVTPSGEQLGFHYYHIGRDLLCNDRTSREHKASRPWSTLTRLPLMHDGLEPAARVDQNFSTNRGDWMTG